LQRMVDLAMNTRSLRRHERTNIAKRVTISWTDGQGTSRYAVGNTLDISSSGIQIKVREQIEPRTYVSFEIEGNKIAGTASVRHCVRTGLSFLVGLEFSGGLTWKSPPSSSPLPNAEET
jgi:hypothetical protein